MNPLKQKYLQDEIKYLLENDFIDPSQSNYSSPCILVPKSNGTYSLCTYPVILSLYMCVFIFGFPCGYF